MGSVTFPLLFQYAKRDNSIFWNVYIALIYGVLYLCFVSYPIVFSELRGWTPGMTGLAYTGIGIGGKLFSPSPGNL